MALAASLYRSTQVTNRKFTKLVTPYDTIEYLKSSGSLQIFPDETNKISFCI